MVTTDSFAVLTKDGVSVSILLLGTNGVKHNMEKDVRVMPIPKSEGRTLNIDLIKFKEGVTITGYLIDDDNSTMKQKKNLLRDMMVASGGNISLLWDSEDVRQPLIGTISKCEVAEIVGTFEGSQDTKILNVMLQFFVGENKG